MIQLIFATSDEGHFGAEKGMPWRHIPQDFKNFKARTENTTLIMGAKTFKSLPSKLVGRQHIVVCDPTRIDTIAAKNGDEPDQLISINEFESILKNRAMPFCNWDESWVSVIGGADLLKRALPFADRVIMTSIEDDYDHKTVTQHLNDSFLFELETKWYANESHYYRMNDTTSITENILYKAENV